MENQPSIKDLLQDYVEVAWRRKLCWLPFPFLAAFVVYYVFSLPPVYESEGTLLVEDQNIPQELIRTTVTSYAAEQMQVIRQQLESTENVSRIIEAFGLYPEAKGVDADPVLLAQRFRNNMNVDTINADILDPQGGRRRTVSIAFRVSFRDHSPELAQAVADELITLFLERNAYNRAREAEQTHTFLREEAETVKERVVILEDRIAEFKGEHAGSLPELLEYNLGIISSSEERIRDNQASVDNLTEQEQLLAIELRGMDPYTGLAVGVETPVKGNGGPVTASSLLAQRRAELSQMSIRYSTSHPTIISLQSEIETLETKIREESGSLSGAANVADLQSPAYLNLRYRMGAIERDIKNLVEENRSLKAQIEEHQKRVANTYVVEREYEDLQREYDATAARYDQLRNAQYEAQVAQSLEEKNQVESLIVLEAPIVPRTAVGPERKKYLVLGFGFAGAMCIGLAILFEFFDERVRGVRGYERLLGQAPIGVVPMIVTAEDKDRLHRERRKIILLAMLAVVLVAVLVGAQLFFVDLRTLV